jgi:hypothetical protein
VTRMARIGPFANACRSTVPLGQSYTQSAPRSPLYSPQSGGPYEPTTEDVSVEGSTLTSVPRPWVRRSQMSWPRGMIAGRVARPLPTTTLPVRRAERGSIWKSVAVDELMTHTAP